MKLVNSKMLFVTVFVMMNLKGVNSKERGLENRAMQRPAAKQAAKQKPAAKAVCEKCAVCEDCAAVNLAVNKLAVNDAVNDMEKCASACAAGYYLLENELDANAYTNAERAAYYMRVAYQLGQHHAHQSLEMDGLTVYNYNQALERYASAEAYNTALTCWSGAGQDMYAACKMACKSQLGGCNNACNEYNYANLNYASEAERYLNTCGTEDDMAKGPEAMVADAKEFCNEECGRRSLLENESESKIEDINDEKTIRQASRRDI